MPLSDSDIQWIGYVAGKDITPQAQADAEARAAQKEAFLKDQLTASLGAVGAEIDSAMDLVIENREIN